MRPFALLALLLLAPVAPALPLAQDDAGSGRDAGEGVDALPLPWGEVARGTLTGIAGDRADEYVFEARAGDRLYLEVRQAYGCAALIEPDGQTWGAACSAGTVPIGRFHREWLWYDGTYVVRFTPGLAQPDRYVFAASLNEEPPALPPV